MQITVDTRLRNKGIVTVAWISLIFPTRWVCLWNSTFSSNEISRAEMGNNLYFFKIQIFFLMF
jgi:hypothetical protein